MIGAAQARKRRPLHRHGHGVVRSACDPLAAAVQWACLTELEALKPGNVGVHGAGHGMRVADFVNSAAVIAEPLVNATLSVGERIYQSVAATRAAVACNTNLGIVLLAAPLCYSAQQCLQGGDKSVPLRARLGVVLSQLDQRDSEQVFAAIRLAAPAGLGRRPQYDVNASSNASTGTTLASVGLREIMQSVASDDRIARQYAEDFVDVFELGLPTYRRARAAGMAPRWAATIVYLTFLSRFCDSHIQRKYGAIVASTVRAEAAHWCRRGVARHCHASAMITRLLAFDQRLKRERLNPGTSADLTVATLLLSRLQRLLEASG